MKSKLIESIVLTEDKAETAFLTKGKCYSFLNPVSYLDALENKELFLKLDGIFVDGGLLAKAIKILYGVSITRRSFDMTSLAPALFNYAVRENKSIYVVASKQEQADRAIDIFKDKYPGLKISGRNGYFNSADEINNEVQNIIAANYDFAIIGMGIIKQEEFLLQLRDSGFQGIGFSCGGFIHQTATNEIDYYPEWVNKYNLRFVYRMYKEKHTRKRYIKAGLIFPIKFIKEKIFG